MPPDVSEASSSATLTLPDGRVLELPVLRDAAGATFLDVRRLYPEHAVCTFDPGFNSTASCASAITYIDGENGRLLYRGYPIEELAKYGDMMDCWHLLLRGTLPTRAQRVVFQRDARGHRMVHEHLIRFFNGFQHDAHPMAIMVSVVGALAAFYDKDHGLDYDDATTRDLAGLRVVGKMTTLAAMAYKTAHGQPIVYPRDDLNLAENFMYMLFGLPTRAYEVDPVAAKCLEVILMLHADHEQNASTSTVRIAGSSKANPFACVAAGVASLWGPAHGGANEAVLAMLEEIGTVENIPKCVARAKDKRDPFRLMGFGHRLYKTVDPRATLMRDMCHDLLAALERERPVAFNRDGVGEDGDERCVLHEPKTVPERRLLQRHLFPRARDSSVTCSPWFSPSRVPWGGSRSGARWRATRLRGSRGRGRCTRDIRRGGSCRWRREEAKSARTKPGRSKRWSPSKGGSWTSGSRCRIRRLAIT
jgi:citrate synthase